MRFLLLSIYFPLLIFLSACSTDLDLVTDWEEGMAVYGILNPQDSTHYIRVNRVFLDPEKSAFLVAENPDSIYYGEELEVKVSAFPGGSEIVAKRVNATDLGIEKNEGVFNNQPNILYRINHELDSEKRYEVQVTNSATGYTASASTQIVGDVSLTFPVNVFAYEFNMNANNQRINFRPAPNGRVYQLILRFHYDEWHVNDPTFVTRKHIDWTLFSQIVTASATSQTIIENNFVANQFYNVVANQIPEDSSLRRRASLNGPFEIVIVSAAEELYNFILAENAQSGLTSGSAPTRYTNVDNGYGIWSSRNRLSFPNWQMSQSSIDSLACSELTRNLNFADRNGFFECN